MPSVWYPPTTGVSTNVSKGAFRITIDGGGSAISNGEKGYISIPYNGTISKWRLMADQTGSITIDLWKDTYGNFPPTSGDSITGTDTPTLSSEQSAESTALTGWTTSVQAGDVVAFNVSGAATLTRVTLIIELNKST